MRIGISRTSSGSRWLRGGSKPMKRSWSRNSPKRLLLNLNLQVTYGELGFTEISNSEFRSICL